MLIKTRGIIFRSKKYSETSVIADIFTEAKGLRSYLVSGVRSKKAKINPSLLQVMSLVDLVVYHREDKDLTRIKEIKAAHIFQSIPFDIRKGAVGLFMAEVARKTLNQPEENSELFKFLFSNFKFLDETEDSIANVHLHFLMQLTGFLGFTPNGEWSKMTPFFDLKEGVFEEVEPVHPHFLLEELSKLISQFLEMPLENCHEVKMNRETRRNLLNHILEFYKWHIENFPAINAHTILEEVLS